MKLSFFIGYRYLWGRSRMGAVNWVSRISSVAMAVVSMALVIVLSVYNGYVGLIKQGNEQISPDLLIRPAEGKLLDLEASTELATALAREGIHSYGMELRELGVLKGANSEQVVEIVGISSNYTDIVHLDSLLFRGDIPKSLGGDTIEALLGMAVASSDRLDGDDLSEDLSLYFPKKDGLINPLAVQSAFEFAYYRPVGILNAIREDVDDKVYIPLKDMQMLLGYGDGVGSGLAISCPEGENVEQFQAKLQEAVGEDFRVLNRDEQHPSLSYLIKMERLMIYVIMIFILLLSGFNLMSSLVMMMMEKRDDLFTLEAMGLTHHKRSLIFTFTGLMISLKGILPGIALGLLLVWGQSVWGFVRSGSEYISIPIPVEVVWADLVSIFIVTMAVSTVVALSPRLLMRKH